MTTSNMLNQKLWELISEDLVALELQNFIVEQQKCATLTAEAIATNKTYYTISDHALLKKILTAALWQDLRKQDATCLYAISFVLRHRVVNLAAMLHAEANNVELKTAPPIIGLSALGIHVLYRNIGICRAFDAYDLVNCNNKTTIHPYCALHAHEGAWKEENSLHLSSSTSAKMFAFYSNKNNISAYDKESLNDLLNGFWHKYAQSIQATKNHSNLGNAIAFFNYPCENALRSAGSFELRKRFAHMVQYSHPDRGGNYEEFLLTQKYYELLKATLHEHSALYKNSGE